eukprot:c11728_g1_i2.p1 GENE.c11728_g1_i2~~c11728_g1_i2.p1  ORF type:complete len:331 (+),score=110.32 c11728_g1_i2:78-1070(+)
MTVECEALERIPSMSEISSNAPAGFIACYVIGTVCVITTICIYLLHYWRLTSQPPTKRRDLYVSIVRTGLIYCVAGFLAVVFPRSSNLFHLITEFYEAWALYNFGLLLINYIAGQNEHDPRAAREKFASALNQLPPAKYLKVPPLGCFFICSTPRIFDRSLVRFVTRCLIQFLYVGPGIGVLRLWYELQCDEPTFKGFDLILNLIRLISILLAVWSLFILYVATKLILHHYNTTYKFFALKGVLLITGVQQILVPIVVSATRKDSFFSEHFISEYVISFCLCVEGFLMTLLLTHSFSVEEVSPTFFAPQHPNTPLIKRGSGQYETASEIP